MAGGIRGILTLVALLIAVALERLASYGARSLYMPQILAEASAARLDRVYLLATVLSIVGYFLAAGITALVKNARITGVIGSVVAIFACVLFLVLDSPHAGAFTLSIASGVVRLCPYVIVGELYCEDLTNEPSPSAFTPTHRVAGVAAFVMAIMFVSQVAGSISNAFFRISHIDGAAAFTTRYFVVLGLMIASTLFMAGALVIHLVGRGSRASAAATVHDPYRAPAPAPEPLAPQAPAPTWGHPWLAGLAVLSFPVAFFTLANDLGNVGQHIAIEQGMTRSTLNMFRMVETGIASFAALLLGVLFLATSITRGRTPPFYFMGAGVVVAGFGTIMKAIGGMVPIYILGGIFGGVSSPLTALGTAYAVTALRGNPRSMFVLTIWYTALMQTSLSLSPVAGGMTSALGSRVPAIGMGLLALVAGAIFLPLMKRVQTAYFTAPQ